jgi:2-polyprenyl-6-methoxyphenol hydroxylase-like FAD-dependent oxidoreductase
LRDAMALPDLFDECPRIDRRIVDWGGACRDLPHGAAVVTNDTLRAAMAIKGGPGDAPHRFVVRTVPGVGIKVDRFGDRTGHACQVALRGEGAEHTCRIEATASGWLFLMPEAVDRGWLLAIGAPADALLAESRTVAPAIDRVGAVRAFDVTPRMASELCGPDWIACGGAALGFDPICGDGAAQAAREAILAAAVIAAIAEGADPEPLLVHYRSMLIAGMRRHLALSVQFYRTGGDGLWWRQQVRALIEGHAHCTQLLADLPEPRFVLRGFRLEPRALAA